MKILRHGRFKAEFIHYQVCCPQCGCVFVAEYGECEEAYPESGGCYAELSDGVTNGFAKVKCPECDAVPTFDRRMCEVWEK